MQQAAVLHMHKIRQERGEDLRFIRAYEKDGACWFYLKLLPEKRAEYELKIKTGNLNIRDYGKILESDWGSYPPRDVVRFMKDTYNFDTPPESTTA
jgi:hypothetical protein